MELTRFRRYLRQEVNVAIGDWQACDQVLKLLDAADQVYELLESYEIDMHNGGGAPGEEGMVFLVGELTQALVTATIDAVGAKNFVAAALADRMGPSSLIAETERWEAQKAKEAAEREAYERTLLGDDLYEHPF